jgi:DNA primase
MFNKSILNDIRDRISISSYVGERVPLKRVGRNLKGLCPFHREKTPSFYVNDEKQIYHCFGCGEGGDIFRFVMKFDGVGFSEAVRQLASRAGVALPRDISPAEREVEREAERRRRILLRINEVARDHFTAALRDSSLGASAREYLQQRGITKEIWTQHFLGYADNEWDSLAGRFTAAGVPLEQAAQLGLIRERKGGGYYDFFRHRIMFPIISPRGEVLGFGGRALDENKQGEGMAKYVNSPDSLIYHKSNCVFGLNLSAGAVRAADQVILVEGYMDLIALHQSGIANTVAPLGTAITSGHIRLLSRYTRNFVLVFDGDEAGVNAAMRSLPLFIDAGLMPRVVLLPGGEDPDTMVRKEGAELFKERLSRAPSLIESFADRTVRSSGADAAGKARAAGQLVPLLRRVSDPVERRIYIRHLARRLDVDEPFLEAAASSRRGAALRAAGAASREGEIVALSAERVLLETMLRHPEIIPEVFAKIDPGRFEDDWCRTVAEVLYDAWQRYGEVRVGQLVEELDDTELVSQMRAAAMDVASCEGDEARALVRDCISKIKEKPIYMQIERLNREIRRAEEEGNDARLMTLLKEKGELAGQVRGNR